jgi:signal transduction histidine kinase
VHRHCRAKNPSELSLLPVALDMIVNAARRQRMEIERARLEQRLHRARRMESIGALATGIAHNFNNIVGAILGYAEIAEARFASGRGITRDLTEIRKAGERARDLVDQILDFGRPRDSRRRPVSLRALLGEAASLLKGSLPASVDLVICDSSLSAVVSAEPAQLQQVIFNLCTNAAQAMDGSGRIEIQMQVNEIAKRRVLSHGELTKGRYSCVRVIDSGRGMDEATLERIFEPFFTTRPDGNGLGLATAREIVREYDGAMHVQSTPGAGSRFEIWLPCIATVEPVTPDAPPILALGRGETLLIIDDNREQLLRAEEILAALGYEPVGFTRVDDALASCYKAPHRYDAFVVGHLTPAKAAIELAAELHKAVPGIPVLLATASVEDVSSRSLVMAGVSEVVTRPLVAPEITAALTRSFAMPPRSAQRG